MAILCSEHDLLYIRVPATGSSVVAQVLQEELDGERVPEQSIRQNGEMVMSGPHCTVPELVAHDVLSRGGISSVMVVANVRNPFDRWATYFQRRAGEEWIEHLSEVLRRQLDRDRDAYDLSVKEYKRRRKAIDRREQNQKRKGRLMRLIGFNNWMKYTLLQWGWSGALGNGRGLGEYAFPMLNGVDVAIRQEQLNEGLNRVLEIAGAGTRLELPEENTTSGKKPYTEYYSWSTRVLVERVLAAQLEKFGYDFEGPADDRRVIFLGEEVGS